MRPRWCVGAVACGRLWSAAVLLWPSERLTLLCCGVRGRARGDCGAQIHFLLLVSRQGKIRLTKYYSRYPASEKTRMLREVATMVLNRSAKMCNFLEWKDKKIIYKRCVRDGVMRGTRDVRTASHHAAHPASAHPAGTRACTSLRASTTTTTS